MKPLILIFLFLLNLSAFSQEFPQKEDLSVIQIIDQEEYNNEFEINDRVFIKEWGLLSRDKGERAANYFLRNSQRFSYVLCHASAKEYDENVDNGVKIFYTMCKIPAHIQKSVEKYATYGQTFKKDFSLREFSKKIIRNILAEWKLQKEDIFQKEDSQLKASLESGETLSFFYKLLNFEKNNHFVSNFENNDFISLNNLLLLSTAFGIDTLVYHTFCGKVSRMFSSPRRAILILLFVKFTYLTLKTAQTAYYVIPEFQQWWSKQNTEMFYELHPTVQTRFFYSVLSPYVEKIFAPAIYSSAVITAGGVLAILAKVIHTTAIQLRETDTGMLLPQ